MEGEALDYMWVLRAVVLCKLSRIQLEGQKRLETLQGSNFIPTLEIVRKANKNH